MIKPIVTDIKELKKISEPVKYLEDYRDIIQDLKDTLQSKGNGFGLSAPQIGVLKQIIYIKLGKEEKILINPELIHRDTKMLLKGEGCLSFPGLSLNTDRYLYIAVRFYDENYAERTELLQDVLSFVVQHEIDHLKGITMHNRKHQDVNRRKK